MDPNQQPTPIVPQITPQPIMANPVPPMSPLPQAPIAPGGTPFPMWYFPDGVKTIFGAKKGVATLSPGLITVVDATTNQEVRRFTIGADLKIKPSFGIARIKFINGSGTSIWDKQYLFYFYNPRFALLSYWFMLMGSSKAKAFAAASMQAAGAQS